MKAACGSSAGWVCALSALLAGELTGCATPMPAPPFQANWYLQQDADTKSVPRLFIAILNRSSDDQTITNIVLNSTGHQLDTGWQRWPRANDVLLEPGRLLVQRLDQFKRLSGKPGPQSDWPNCALPVQITVITTRGAPVVLTPTGQLPSALPQGWEECPAP